MSAIKKKTEQRVKSPDRAGAPPTGLPLNVHANHALSITRIDHAKLRLLQRHIKRTQQRHTERHTSVDNTILPMLPSRRKRSFDGAIDDSELANHLLEKHGATWQKRGIFFFLETKKMLVEGEVWLPPSWDKCFLAFLALFSFRGTVEVWTCLFYL